MTNSTQQSIPASTKSSVPIAAWLLGVSGLIPFVGLSLSVAVETPIERTFAATALSFYGAIILSFMSGVHWGLTMRGSSNAVTAGQSPIVNSSNAGKGPSVLQDVTLYGASVFPALIAWFALILLPTTWAMAAIAAAFAGLLVYDFAMIKRGYAPAWYALLRIPLTAVVVASLALAAAVL
ncbi:MAG: DUF3429 domain-containing protein [Pseudomonadota bacterium]